MLDGVEAEAVNTAREPEAHHRVNRGGDVRVSPIQIGLRRQIRMVVVLTRERIVGPGGSAEFAQPVVGRSAVTAIAPDVPIALGITARGTAFHKPGMGRGRVIGHQIHDDLEAVSMSSGHQGIEFIKGAEDWIDPHIVRHVVAEVRHGRGIDRRQPDRIHTQRRDVGKPVGDALEVADTVAVAVLKGARVDLVDHAPLPPRVIYGRSWSRRQGPIKKLFDRRKPGASDIVALEKQFVTGRGI